MKRLTVQSITSIGAVESADNPESKIMFWKRKTIEPVPGLVEKQEGSMPFDVESLTDEGKEYVAGLQAQIDSAVVVEETPDALPDDLPDIVAKRLDEQSAAIEKDRVEKEALQKEVADLKDGIATEKYDTEADEYADMLGPDMGPVLKAIGTATPVEYRTLMDRLGVIKNLESLDSVLKEYGDSAATGSAVDQIAAHATEIRKNQPELSMAQAKAQAWQEHPDLKSLSREEGN